MISRLPPEIVIIACEFLSSEELRTLSRTNRRNRGIVKKNFPLAYGRSLEAEEINIETKFSKNVGIFKIINGKSIWIIFCFLEFEIIWEEYCPIMEYEEIGIAYLLQLSFRRLNPREVAYILKRRMRRQRGRKERGERRAWRVQKRVAMSMHIHFLILHKISAIPLTMAKKQWIIPIANKKLNDFRTNILCQWS